MERILKMIHASYAYRHGYYGKGIGVAILDTGISPHRDLRGQIRGFRDYVDRRPESYDDNGHGTHISGIIGANGEGSIHGIAPKCNLYGYKILDRNGSGRIEDICMALDRIKEVNRSHPGMIRIVNISVGMTESADSLSHIKLLKKVEAVWDSGVVVLAAAGNNGPGDHTITSPGISRKIITVGSLDDGTRKNGIRGYSGRGPTAECVVKPEILMPGSNILSCANRGDGYIRKSGTSMAVPVLTGALALFMNAYPHLTPNQIKLRLFYAAQSEHLYEQNKSWGTITMDRLL